MLIRYWRVATITAIMFHWISFIQTYYYTIIWMYCCSFDNVEFVAVQLRIHRWIVFKSIFITLEKKSIANLLVPFLDSEKVIVCFKGTNSTLLKNRTLSYNTMRLKPFCSRISIFYTSVFSRNIFFSRITRQYLVKGRWYEVFHTISDWWWLMKFLFRLDNIWSVNIKIARYTNKIKTSLAMASLCTHYAFFTHCDGHWIDKKKKHY